MGIVNALCLTLALLSGGEDVLVLQDGRIFDGVDLERTEEGIVIHYEHGDVSVPAEMVLDALIEDQATWEPTTDEEREKFEQGFVPFEGKWMSLKRRDALIEDRIEEKRLMVEDIKAHQLWRDKHEKATRHFLFQYTVPEHLFAPYRDKMEAYFTAFAKDWRVKQPKKPGKLPVCFYNDRQYFQQVSGAGGGVIGYFRFVTPIELNFFFDRLDPELTEAVMYHETNHYLQSLIDPDFAYPHFPGESLAEYYGASHYDPDTKKFTTGLVQEGRLAEVKQDVLADEMMGLEEMILDERTYEHYTWGWTLVHFLMSDKKNAKRFQSFVLELAKGKGVQRESMGFGTLRTVRGPELLRVFKDELGLRDDEDFTQLEADWHAYVRDNLDFVSHRGLERAAIAAASAGMTIKGRRLFQEAVDAGTQNPMTFHHYAELLEREGDRGAAIAQWRRAIELDPLEAEFRLSLGQALHAQGDKEDGLRTMRLALEMDEDVASWGFDFRLLEELQAPESDD